MLCYLVLLSYGIWWWRGPDDSRFYVLVLSMIFYFILITHFTNDIEQQRMRVTIGPLYGFLLIGLLSDVIPRFRGRAPRT